MNRILAPFKPLWLELKRGNISALLARYSDLLLPFGLLLVIGTFFIPIPTALLSALIIVNLAVSIIVLMTSLYISSPTQLTSYPTILLLTTVFRLGLSISATRGILTQGYAGDVIESLGHITAQGSIIVGAVIFLMILVVQFIVVAKGSERVAEVAARFTLDAMPGKQMSIDADMRSGLIPQDQARRARTALQKESQLYGAMDGAMKFVKGDSIATIIIALINIAGGLAIGVGVNGMGFGAAAQKYTIMTIGDGLAAIISSLLITFSAGIVVTRVSTDEDTSNVGSDISTQLLANPKPWLAASALLIGLAVIPGMPHWPLLFVGAGVVAIGYSLLRAQKAVAKEEAERVAKTGAAQDGDELQPTFAVPLAVVVSEQLTYLIDKNTPSGTRFRTELPKLRSSLYYDLGVMLPNCYVSGDAPLQVNQYFIAVKEVPVVYGSIRPDCVYINDSAENIKVFGLEGEEVRNPADLKPGAWIPAAQRAIAERAGLKVWEPAEVITLHLSMVLKKYAHEFVGIQEAQGYLDFAARGMPKLVEEVVPKVVTIHQLTDVLQRLVQESISIRDIKTILDALSEWGRIEKDPVMLTEYVRSSMKRYISFRYTNGRDTLFVYLLDPEIEDVIRGAIRRTSTGSFLSLDPHISHDILDAIRREIANLPASAQKPVVITDMELRRFVRRMVELEFPTLSVLSYQELAPELNVQPVGRITMRPAAPPAANFLPDAAQTAMVKNF
ncbi:MAG TPA: type III secretion system export apparatus subunit SctV [Pyrinomonadaceae bacterium]|nr:type III secretion system export apparatus subunit SctV [Pyrinomonadaceae bacterium]